MRRFCPTAVDVSSNVETQGIKDPEKMMAFAEAVRKASPGKKQRTRGEED